MIFWREKKIIKIFINLLLFSSAAIIYRMGRISFDVFPLPLNVFLPWKSKGIMDVFLLLRLTSGCVFENTQLRVKYFIIWFVVAKKTKGNEL